MKATCQAHNLSDGSIVFDVWFDDEPVAHPPSQAEAEAIAEKINWLIGNRYVEGLFDKNELKARRAEALQLERMVKMIIEVAPATYTIMGSECDHAEVVLRVILKDYKQNAAFRHMFLATFEQAVNKDKDEPINGADAVDRIVEFVRALQGKAGE